MPEPGMHQGRLAATSRRFTCRAVALSLYEGGRIRQTFRVTSPRFWDSTPVNQQNSFSKPLFGNTTTKEQYMKSSKINRLNFAHPWALVCLFAVLAPVIAVMCFALLPTARAECRDGCALYDNTYQGDNALANLALTQSTETSGINNTAVGSQALKNSTTARGNTAVGANALYNNTTGHQNIGIGIQALQSNTTGTENVAIGGFALTYNNGSENVAIGDSALGNNSTAGYNVAVGHQALVANTTGFGNTGIGHTVLVSNTTGNYNTAYGFAALWFGTGSSNIALGYQAGYNLTTGNNNIDIGALGVAADSGTIRIGTQGT